MSMSNISAENSVDHAEIATKIIEQVQKNNGRLSPMYTEPFTVFSIPSKDQNQNKEEKSYPDPNLQSSTSKGSMEKLKTSSKTSADSRKIVPPSSRVASPVRRKPTELVIPDDDTKVAAAPSALVSACGDGISELKQFPSAGNILSSTSASESSIAASSKYSLTGKSAPHRLSIEHSNSSPTVNIIVKSDSQSSVGSSHSTGTSSKIQPSNRSKTSISINAQSLVPAVETSKKISTSQNSLGSTGSENALNKITAGLQKIQPQPQEGIPTSKIGESRSSKFSKRLSETLPSNFSDLWKLPKSRSRSSFDSEKALVRDTSSKKIAQMEHVISEDGEVTTQSSVSSEHSINSLPHPKETLKKGNARYANSHRSRDEIKIDSKLLPELGLSQTLDDPQGNKVENSEVLSSTENLNLTEQSLKLKDQKAEMLPTLPPKLIPAEELSKPIHPGIFQRQFYFGVTGPIQVSSEGPWSDALIPSPVLQRKIKIDSTPGSFKVHVVTIGCPTGDKEDTRRIKIYEHDTIRNEWDISLICKQLSETPEKALVVVDDLLKNPKTSIKMVDKLLTKANAIKAISAAQQTLLHVFGSWLNPQLVNNEALESSSDTIYLVDFCPAHGTIARPLKNLPKGANREQVKDAIADLVPVAVDSAWEHHPDAGFSLAVVVPIGKSQTDYFC